MSAAPQEPHYLPGCLVLLLGKKGAPGERERELIELRPPSAHFKSIVGKSRQAGREEGVGFIKEVSRGP